MDSCRTISAVSTKARRSSFQGPFGDFILRPPLRDTVFIASGTGIAPFRSMLHWLLAESDRHQGRKFWLLFGARREQDIYYREEFEHLAAEHANFHFLPTLSRGCSRVEGPARIRAGTSGRNRWHPYRHARLHLRPRQDGQGESRVAEESGLGSGFDPLRKIRLTS